MDKMATKDLEHEIKKKYNISSFIAVIAYVFYYTSKKIEGYFWLNYIALTLLILNSLFIIYNLYQIYQNKNQIEKVSNYYIKGSLSLLLNLIIIFSIYTLF